MLSERYYMETERHSSHAVSK